VIPLGPYLLDRPIGLGGMGEVWSGRHRDEPVPVAVKLLFKHDTDEDYFQAQVQNEVRAVAALDHPGVVRIFDQGRVSAESAGSSRDELVEGTPYMVMELLTGGTLVPEVGKMDWPRLRHVLLSILGALGHAHAHGVIHRDLKPGNVLLDAGGSRVVLTDFGLASLAHERDTEDGWVQGTPAYMAPEQVLGIWRDQGPWTDLYSLGALTWALAMGLAPFGRDPMKAQERHLNDAPPKLEKSGFPAELDGWVRRLMSKRPRNRFARAAEAAAALESLGSTPRLVLPRSWKETHAGLPPSLRGPGRGLVGVRTLSLVNREKERDALWAELRLVVNERKPRAVVLRGPTGHGKSRLAHWIGTRAHELGLADWLDVRHEPDEGVDEPLASMVLRAIRGVGLDRSELLARLGGDSDHVQALVQALMPTEGGVQFDSERERLATFAHFIELRARARPLVLWLDDVQWGVQALDLASQLMNREVPVLLVLTVQNEAMVDRPDAAAKLAWLREHQDVRTVDVGRLKGNHTRQLVEDMLGLSPGLAGRVAERTGGNPLFAVQLVQDWVQRDLVELSETGFRLRDGAVATIPDHAHAIWDARLGRLLDHRDPTEAHSLEVAAVLGQTVARDEWFAACFAADLRPAMGRVELLVAERLVRMGGQRWGFVHAMLRESLLRRAREGGRLESWHAACVAMLGPRDDARGVERRARHLMGAGAMDHAVPLLQSSAEHRLRLGDHPGGHALLDLRRQALNALGVAEDDQRWGWQFALRSHLYLLGGAPEQAQTLAEKAHALGFTTGSAALLVRATRLLGVLAKASDPATAQRFLEAAIQAGSLSHDPGELARSRRALAEVFTSQGHHDEAVEQLEQAITLFGRSDDPAGVGTCCASMAWVRRQQGEPAAARSWLEKAARAFEKAGNRRGLAGCLNDLADLDRANGRLKRAEQRLHRARELYLAVGRPTWVPEINLGLVLVAQQRHGEARAVLEPLARFLQQRGRSALYLHAGMGLTPALAGLRDWGALDTWLDSLETELERTGVVDADLARAAERAMALCSRQDKPGRASRLKDLGLRQWQALGRDAEVNRLLAVTLDR
jgi:eukaryotic-like serine/threonine-protein kinase